MRALLALAVVAPALAGCLGQSDVMLTAQRDDAAPHCVGECGRIVDGSPARAWEPFLAVDPKDPDHIVIAHGEQTDGFVDHYLRAGRARVSVTQDGGATWETRSVLSGLDVGPTHPLARYKAIGFDPVLVFLPDGTVVMSAIATNSLVAFELGVPAQVWRGFAVYTSRSTDGGRTWGDVRIVDAGEGVAGFDDVVGANAGVGFKFNDKEWVTVGPDGTLLLVWTQGTQGHPDDGLSQEAEGRLVFSSSDDGGLSWSPARIVDDEGYPLGASPVFGRDGAWHVAYLDAASGDMRFAESHDHGQTWDARTLGTTTWMPVMRAQTLASGVERLLLIYTTGGAFLGGEHQTELTWSDDGGGTWAPALLIDTPQGEGTPMPDVVGAPDGSAWVTFFDIEGGSARQHSRYLAMKVVDGVAGGPLVLDEMETTDAYLGHYMGLGATPDGDALAAWVTYEDGEYDLVWARITEGADYVPGATDWASAQPRVPTGLGEPVAYEFTGHVNVPYYCYDPNPTLEQAVRDQASATFEFDVPPDARFVNGTLDYERAGPTPETSDLDVTLYDSKGDVHHFGSLDVPQTFNIELHEGDQGAWTAVVTNCQNPPTDFTLSLLLS